MLLIAFILALLVIVAGMKLMAQAQRESLGNLYKYVSWFVVVMGFLCLLGAGLHGIIRCHRNHCERMEMRCEMSTHNGCNEMMHCNHGMMSSCMMHGGGCNDMMESGCTRSDGNCTHMNGDCKEKMESSCEMGDGGSCPMMKDGKHCEEKDTVIVKKEIKK